MKRTVFLLVSCMILSIGVWADDFGDGSDGSLDVIGILEPIHIAGTLSEAVAIGATTLQLEPRCLCLSDGDEILIVTTQAPSGSGVYEFAVAQTVDNQPELITLTLASPLTRAFGALPMSTTIVVAVRHYTTVNVTPTGTLKGEVLAFRAADSVTINGAATTTGEGHRGGISETVRQGESQTGGGGTGTGNAGGGGGGGEDAIIPPGGGGGGYANPGATGQATSSGGFPTTPGTGGATYGQEDFATQIHYGSGGGVGGHGLLGRNTFGGNGGGIIFICAPTIAINGTVESNGTDGEDGQGSVIWTAGGAGGGSGGSIWLRSSGFSGNGSVSAAGGFGGFPGSGTNDTGGGGEGGDGRVRIDGLGYDSFSVSAGSVYHGPAPIAEPTPTPEPPSTSVDLWEMYR